MLITKETDYALRILRALASVGRRTARDLAEQEQIPRQFAYKILKKLEKSGLVRITRGADGGCALAADLSHVTLYRLILAMERDSAISDCTREGYLCGWREAHGGAVCRAHNHLSSIQRALDRELDSHTLQEILFDG